MKLTAKNVQDVFLDCLFRDGEDTSKAKLADGVLNTFGFHPERLILRTADIQALLAQLPDQFRASAGGGWSFLNACETRDGEHWGEHQNIEQLMVLGIASGQVRLPFPRAQWGMLPGAMPYFVVVNL